MQESICRRLQIIFEAVFFVKPKVQERSELNFDG